MADIFREVDDDLAQERAERFWKRFRTPILTLAVLIVVGAGAWRVYDQQRIKAAEEAGARFQAAVQLSREGKLKEAEAALGDIAKSGPAGYGVLAKFRAAGDMSAEDADGAVKIFDALAADAAIDAGLRELARMRAAILRLDQADAGELQRRLEPLAQAGQTYRYTARELLAVAALKRNDFDAAGKWLDMIVTDGNAPAEIRQRAEALLSLVAGGKK